MPFKKDNQYHITELEYRKDIAGILRQAEAREGTAYECLRDGVGYLVTPKAYSSRRVCDLTEAVFGQKVAIVGKGPSLDRADLKTLLTGYGFIFCVNQSIHVVDKALKSSSTACIQLDSILKDTCSAQYGYMIARNESRHFYYKHPRLVTLDSVCDSFCGTAVALRICGVLGAKSASLIAHDALTTGDCSYANSLKGIFDPDGKSAYKKYGTHFKTIAESYALPLNIVA